MTADHRYQLYLNGEILSFGPDRSDVEHWSVATVEAACETGPNELTALVWHIAEAATGSRMDPKHAKGDLVAANPPMAQMTYRPGFLLCGDGDTMPGEFDTGAAPWTVEDLTDSVSMSGPGNLGYHDIGPAFTIRLSDWDSRTSRETLPVVVAGPPAYNVHGVKSPGWVLSGTPLPEQERGYFHGGSIRAWRRGDACDKVWSDGGDGDGSDWNELLRAGRPVEIAAGETVEVLWDFDSYQCGYPVLVWSSGSGARIQAEWAEALYHATPGQPLDCESPKGNRDEIHGKSWLGFGDTFIASGANNESAPALWWRSGRFVRLKIAVGETPLKLQKLGILTTGYPLEPAWKWESSDAEWDDVLRLLGRGLELGAHETWTDSPYYEQLAYVGDQVLHMLSNYVGYPDLRLTRRALDLFNWSRTGCAGGLVAERYPSQWRQESSTYAMLYPQMLANHARWAGDSEFLRGLLPGLRQLIESLLALRNENGLLGVVPGWPFVDWVPSWYQGYPPGAMEGDSSIVNLHLVHALKAAAAVEDYVGEACFAERCRRIAGEIFDLVMDRYWDDELGLIRDSRVVDTTSEHAQILGLLSGMLGDDKERSCLRHLVDGTLPAQATISFSHYLLDVFAIHREEEAFFRRLEFWRKLPGLGFRSIPEAPEPTRSDCHGWGAHPLFHSFASIAGIRPGGPGFASVSIHPMPGPLKHFTAGAVHPLGTVRVAFRRESDGSCVFRVQLPASLPGTLIWNSRTYMLVADGTESEIRVPAGADPDGV